MVRPDAGDIIGEAGEAHPLDPQEPCHPLQTFALLAAPKEGQRHVATAPLLLSEDPEQNVLPLLLGVEASDAGEPEPARLARPRQRIAPIDEEGIANDAGGLDPLADLLLGEAVVVIGDEEG